MTEVPKKCVTCQWWDNSVNLAFKENSGLCRLLPPTANRKSLEAIWPFTDQDDWCAAWKYDGLGWGDGVEVADAEVRQRSGRP